MRTERKSKLKKLATETLIILVSVAVVLSVVRFVEAGSLTPPGAPASTMSTNQQIYDVLVASSSTALLSVTASAQGDALQITKCIIRKVQGLSCP